LVGYFELHLKETGEQNCTNIDCFYRMTEYSVKPGVPCREWEYASHLAGAILSFNNVD